MDSAGFCAFARPSKPRHSCVDLRIERARRGKGNEAKTVLFIQRFAASHCFPRAIHPAAQKKKPSSVKGQGLSRIVVPPHTGYSGHPFISASHNGGKPSEPTRPRFQPAAQKWYSVLAYLYRFPPFPALWNVSQDLLSSSVHLFFLKILISIIQENKNCQAKAK